MGGTSRQSAGRKGQNLPEAPPGIEDKHDQESSAQQQEYVVEETLAERYLVVGIRCLRVLRHGISLRG
jgi:hypothetical protein